MRVTHYDLRGQSLLEHHLRNGKRKKRHGRRRKVLPKLGQVPVVVNRWGLEHERRRLRSKVVLQVALQFHSPVLEPCPHLMENNTSEYIQNHSSSPGRRKPLWNMISCLKNTIGLGWWMGVKSAFTWVSERLSFCAVVTRSPASKYLCLLKIFSNLLICSGVNLVRTRRCGPSVSASHPLSSTERHSDDAASLSYPEEYPLVSETAKWDGNKYTVENTRKKEIKERKNCFRYLPGDAQVAGRWLSVSSMGLEAFGLGCR